ncbi:hypothetical protein ACN26Y_29885 [Micromonospora sp. WMMD558]|uniref:hypothetical protein n=1 Tax=Micromonospora sp. WMMD558 TaxID=3403462 RepID=UPI003BF4CF43
MSGEKTQARPTEPVKQSPAKKAAPAAKQKQEPVARAGGYVDRGDGNGWELEEAE